MNRPENSARFRTMKRGLLLLGCLLISFSFVRTGASEDMDSLLEDIRAIEFNHIHYNTPRADYFRYIEGSIPVLISAPHGTRHYRRCGGDGFWKDEDAYTSSLAIKLGQLTGAHVLYAKYKAAEDPNSDPDCGYKALLQEKVRAHGIGFVLDLHGAAASRDFRVDVGTLSDTPEGCSCVAFKPLIAKAFRGIEERLFNKQFKAAEQGTITSFVKRELGIEAAQFEINACCRVVQSRSSPSRTAREEDIIDMITRFRRMILEISEAIEKNRASVEARKR